MGTTIDLTPSPQMVESAKRALALADARSEGIEAATKARAQRIAEGKPLTPAQVKRMVSFFSITRDARTPEWGKSGSETNAFIAHSLYGGDAGQIWAKAKVRELGVSLSDDDGDTVIFKELFCEDPTTPYVDDDGYVWKPVLRTGYWQVGPHGKPLMVIAGNSTNPRLMIGLQDIVDAHEEGAIEHVTIPTSHDDLVDQNTGYVDAGKLKIVKGDDGTSRLWAGHRFTDAAIKQKVLDGSIANTSVGLEFDYVRKEDGRTFPIVLKHVALTNRPWINRLTPFGVAASEDAAVEYDIECLTFSEPIEDEKATSANDPTVTVWDGGLTFDEIQESIAEQIDGEVVQVAHDRALVKVADKHYVAKFSIESGEVAIEEKDKWSEHNAPTLLEDDHNEQGTSMSGDDPKLITSTSEEEETNMSDKDTKTEIKLSEQPEFKAIADENARLRAQLDQVMATNRKNEADDLVRDLKGYGFTEKAGCTEFLKMARNIVLSDTGETSLLFSEEDSDAAERPMTAIQIVRELFSKLPKATAEGKKLAVQFSEIASDPLGRADEERPPLDAEESEKVALSEEELDALHADLMGRS